MSYRVQKIVRDDLRYDQRYREHVERRMTLELGEKLVGEIPLDEPTMVRISKDSQFDFDLRATVVRYEFELTPCRYMETTIPRYREVERIIYVDKPVYVPKPPPPPLTPWQNLAAFLDRIAPEVEYDGGYGD